MNEGCGDNQITIFHALTLSTKFNTSQQISGKL